MSTSQRRLPRTSRSLPSEHGLARLEVLAREGDRDLIRSLARQLATDGPESTRIRTLLGEAVAGGGTEHGGILSALRRSPLVASGLDLTRERMDGRRLDL